MVSGHTQVDKAVQKSSIYLIIVTQKNKNFQIICIVWLIFLVVFSYPPVNLISMISSVAAKEIK